MRSLLILAIALSACAFAQTIAAREGENVTLPAFPKAAATIEPNGPQDFDRRQLDNVDDTERIAPNWWPHPYLETDLAAMPGGYAPAAAYGEAGIDVEQSSLLAHADFGYDNGRKTDDGDQPNPKGHDRYLSFSGYWRLPHHNNWFAGGGWQWSQLSTTNYTKGGSHPFLGAGYDLFFDHQSGECAGNCWMSARFTLDYFTPGTDSQNSSHGVEVSFIMPRPIEKRHLFFVSSFMVYRSNETVTDPTNIQLTQQQKADKFFDASSTIGVRYRFR